MEFIPHLPFLVNQSFWTQCFIKASGVGGFLLGIHDSSNKYVLTWEVRLLPHWSLTELFSVFLVIITMMSRETKCAGTDQQRGSQHHLGQAQILNLLRAPEWTRTSLLQNVELNLPYNKCHVKMTQRNTSFNCCSEQVREYWWLGFHKIFCYLNRSRHPHTFNSMFIPTSRCSKQQIKHER